MGFSQPGMPPCSLESPTQVDGGVVEISLLLPKWQARALEREAHDRGQTTGQLVRRLIGEHLLENAQA
jgi:hypothetical protein